MELLEKVSEVFRGRQQKKVGDFAELVKAVIADKAPSPAKIAEMLEASDKTPDDLQEAIAHRRQRLELRKKLDSISALKKQHQDVQRQYDQEQERFAAEEERHENVLGPLRYQGGQLYAEIADCESATSKLRRTAPDELQEQASAVESKRAKIVLAIQAEQEAIHNVFILSRSINPQTGHLYTDAEMEPQLEAYRAPHRQRVAELQKLLPPLDAQLADIAEAMLQP
jgi:dihydrodipicolinate synthase/N-acetylneuraminate lyase